MPSGRVPRHGEAGGKNSRRSPEYTAWAEMRKRVLNPNHRSYRNYGGRGITICERWLESYENFLADMGRKPSTDHSLDRIDNDGNYEPTNCHWATRSEQARNRRPAAYVGWVMIPRRNGTWTRHERGA
jgi:hypothetical protein